MTGYWVRQGMKDLVPLWVAVFLVSCVGAVNMAVSPLTVTAQLHPTTSAAVFYNAFIGENYNEKNPESMQGFTQLQDNSVVTYRVLRGRHFLSFSHPASILLNDRVRNSQDIIMKMNGTAFFLLIENNANAPPWFSDAVL